MCSHSKLSLKKGQTPYNHEMPAHVKKYTSTAFTLQTPARPGINGCLRDNARFGTEHRR
jgi:hypothetical protein